MVDSRLCISGMEHFFDFYPLFFQILSFSLFSHVVTSAEINQEIACIAQWEDEQIEYIKEKVTEEGRQEDLKKGKAPVQVLLWWSSFI